MSKPFTDEEIVALYRGAKNKKSQLRICAELHLCTVEEIKEIIGMTEGGVDVANKYDWKTIDKAIKDGMTVEEAQAKYGFTREGYYYHKNYSKTAGTNKDRLGSKKRYTDVHIGSGAASKRKATPKVQTYRESTPDGLPAGSSAHKPAFTCSEPVTLIATTSKIPHEMAQQIRPWYADDIQRMAQIIATLKPGDSASLHLKAEEMVKQILTEMFSNRPTGPNH